MERIKTPRGFMVYLAGLSIIGFLSTDMYLPAFEVMRDDFETTKTNIGASLSVFLAGFAIAQLFWGPFSDRFGKRRAILWGLGLFTVASLGIFLTHSVVMLLILRVIQALGVCAATVCWQALVIERFPKDKTDAVFASIMPLVALSPALAPLLGAYLVEHLGWRYIFIVLVGIAGMLVFYASIIDRTSGVKTKSKIGEKSQPKIGYKPLFKSPYYLGNVMIYAFCSAGFFAWLTGAPFFLTEMGYSEAEIGWSFVPQTIAFLLGGYGYKFIVNRVSGNVLLPYLLHIYALSMFAILCMILFTEPTLTGLLIPFCIMAFSNGACYPIAVAEALKPFPQASGKASALQNTLQLGACFVASAAVSLFSTQALLTTGIVMMGTVVFVYWGLGLRRK